MTCWTMLASGTLTPIDAVAFARRWVSAVAKSRGDIFPLLSRAQTQLLLAVGKINAAQQKPMTQRSHRKAVCVFVQCIHGKMDKDFARAEGRGPKGMQKSESGESQFVGGTPPAISGI